MQAKQDEGGMNVHWVYSVKKDDDEPIDEGPAPVAALVVEPPITIGIVEGLRFIIVH